MPAQVLVTQTIVASSAPVETGRLTPKVRNSIGGPSGTPESKYDVTITGGRPQSRPEQPQKITTSFSYDEKPMGRPLPPTPGMTSPMSPTSGRRPSLIPQSMVITSAMLSYTKVAVLFFIAMMMTWIPSSANRLYSVIYDGEVSLFLEQFSAFVLPLQGLWNAVIYAATSMDACKSLYRQIKENKLSSRGIRNIWRGFPVENDLFHENTVKLNANPRRSRHYDNKNESQIQLKESRPQTGKSRGIEGGDLTIRVASREERDYHSTDESYMTKAERVMGA